MDLKKIIDKKDWAAQYMIDEITHIIKTFEKRDPGSKGELQACEYMADVLKKDCGCDSAEIESFKENPGSFFGWIYFTITFVLLSILLYFVFPLASVILISLGLFIALMQFGTYKKFVDWAFKEKTGHNVTAVKKPTGEVKRRLRSRRSRLRVSRNYLCGRRSILYRSFNYLYQELRSYGTSC